MTVLPEDLKTYITASTSISNVIGTRCHYNQVPQSSAYPHVWIQRQSIDEELDMSGTGGLANTTFILECSSTGLSEAYSLADKVRARLHGVSGTIGNTTARGVFVADQDEDYIPRNNDADEGIHVAALSVTVWHLT